MAPEPESDAAFQARRNAELERRMAAGQNRADALMSLHAIETKRNTSQPWTASDWLKLGGFLLIWVGLCLLPFAIGVTLYSAIAPITRVVIFVGAIAFTWQKTGHLEPFQRLGLVMVVWAVLLVLDPLVIARWAFDYWVHGMNSFY